jgi:hypothetical protein
MSKDDLELIVDRAVEATDAKLITKGLPTTDDHLKAAKRTARKLASGGWNKKQKKTLVSKWTTDMKAYLKGGKK